jgi:periplasmic protein TonB
MRGRGIWAILGGGLLAACAGRGTPAVAPPSTPSRVEPATRPEKPSGGAPISSEADPEYDLAPIPIRITKPEYPAAAREKAVHGRVMVEFVIDALGHVSSARVVRSIPGLDAAAIECVRNWQFRPALRGGRPVETRARAPVEF